MVAIAIIMLPSGASHLHHPLFHEDLIDFHSELPLMEKKEGKYGPCVCACVCVCMCVIYLLFISQFIPKRICSDMSPFL